jgi:hypothetical protein
MRLRAVLACLAVLVPLVGSAQAPRYQPTLTWDSGYKKRYFVSYDTATGQAYTRWADEPFKKFGDPIDPAGAEPGAFFFVTWYSGEHEKIRHSCIDTRTGQLWSKWEKEPWKKQGAPIDAAGKALGRFALAQDFATDVSMFYYFTVDGQTGQAYTQWEKEGWKPREAPIAREPAPKPAAPTPGGATPPTP